MQQSIVRHVVKVKLQHEEEEGFINLSNVMLVSPTDSKPCRVNFKVLEDGKKVRVSARTKQVM